MKSNYGFFSGLTFSDVFGKYEDFFDEWKSCPFYARYNEELEDVVEETYYHLYANYANSTIKSNDVNRFKFKLFEIFIVYGPTWRRKIEIQKKLRTLSEEDLLVGSSELYNHAQNPATIGGSTEELPYIDRQTSTKRKRSMLDAYTRLIDELSANHTEQYIRNFRKLFAQIAYPDGELLYSSIT